MCDDWSLLGGDAQLGGDDVDAAIVKWLIKEHLAYVPQLRKTTSFLSKLKQLSESAKIQLSTGTNIMMKFVRSPTVASLKPVSQDSSQRRHC